MNIEEETMPEFTTMTAKPHEVESFYMDKVPTLYEEARQRALTLSEDEGMAVDIVDNHGRIIETVAA